MSLRKATTRNVPEISVKNADVSGKMVLTAKSLDPTAVYSWEYSVDQATWTCVPETRKARTELSGLQSACTYSFRYCASTRAGQKDYSQVVSLLVR